MAVWQHVRTTSCIHMITSLSLGREGVGRWEEELRGEGGWVGGGREEGGGRMGGSDGGRALQAKCMYSDEPLERPCTGVAGVDLYYIEGYIWDITYNYS